MATTENQSPSEIPAVQRHWVCMHIAPTGRSYSPIFLSLTSRIPVREPKLLCSRHVKICFAVYYRSTLSKLSDIYHQKFNFTSYYSCKEHWMSLITKKKVEIWHSVLRAAIQVHNCADKIRKKAITLAMSKSRHACMAQFVKSPIAEEWQRKTLR